MQYCVRFETSHQTDANGWIRRKTIIPAASLRDAGELCKLLIASFDATICVSVYINQKRILIDINELGSIIKDLEDTMADVKEYLPQAVRTAQAV